MKSNLGDVLRLRVSENSSKSKIIKRLNTIKKTAKLATWEDMQRIPAGEEDLIDVPVYITMLTRKPVDSINANEIKSSAFRNIYFGKP